MFNTINSPAKQYRTEKYNENCKRMQLKDVQVLLKIPDSFFFFFSCNESGRIKQVQLLRAAFVSA